MAMSFHVGGQKRGFDRRTFVAAMCESGMTEVQANTLIERIASVHQAWKELIGESFLPDNMKTAYYRLLDERLSRL